MRASQQSSAHSKSAQFKRGEVVLIDGENPWRVRVKFEDEDGVQSFWLSIMAKGAKGNRHAHTPRIGEQVACLVDWRGEDGVILGGLYSEADARPAAAPENDHVSYEDGTVFDHDPKTKTRRLILPEGGTYYFGVGQTRMKFTKEGIVASKPIALGDVPDVEVRKK